jgi:hypothetical protein
MSLDHRGENGDYDVSGGYRGTSEGDPLRYCLPHPQKGHCVAILMMVTMRGPTQKLLAASEAIEERVGMPAGLVARVVVPLEDGMLLLHMCRQTRIFDARPTTIPYIRRRYELAESPVSPKGRRCSAEISRLSLDGR